MSKPPVNLKMDAILRSIDQLRPIPTSVTRILQAIDDPGVTAELIAEYIGLDQALAALVLRVANAASLGYSRTCTSLNEAVMRLGFKRIKSLAIAAVANGPSDRSLVGYRLGSGDLWNHGISAAVATEWLANELHYPNPEEAYAAGLLHDMGKLVLDQYVLFDYTRIVEMMQAQRITLWKAEQELFGIDHAGVGSLVAERWHFPIILVDAIHYHHAPSLARSKPELPALVNFANAVVCRNSKSLFDIYNKTVHPETPGILRLNQANWVELEKSLLNYLTIFA